MNQNRMALNKVFGTENDGPSQTAVRPKLNMSTAQAEQQWTLILEHPLKVALSALNLHHVWFAMFTNNAKKDDKIKSKLGNIDKE